MPYFSFYGIFKENSDVERKNGWYKVKFLVFYCSMHLSCATTKSVLLVLLAWIHELEKPYKVEIFSL